MRSAKRRGSEPSFVPRLTTTVVGVTCGRVARSTCRPCGVVRPVRAFHATSRPPSMGMRKGRMPTASESPTTSTGPCAARAAGHAQATTPATSSETIPAIRKRLRIAHALDR